MDAYTPQLLERGLKGMIGKGIRNNEVVDAIKKNKAVYFAAIGGAGALLAEAIKEANVLAFEDLGPEAIYQLKVENFPVTVIIDSEGNDLYKMGKEQYRQN
jgi:fumarate hydratase subunit beta